MILIGMFDSPFVRRVAVSMNLLGMPFEHRNWSVGKDFERIREFNPLGRVPTLVPSDGEALRIMAVATGAAEKGVTQVYETVFRPPEKRYRLWTERCHTQMHAALAELDRLSSARAGEWLIGNRMTQPDIAATCVYTFLVDALDINRAALVYPALAATAERAEALAEFRS